MSAVDWSKEPGHGICCLPDGTEVYDVTRWNGRQYPTFENGFVARMDEIKAGFKPRADDVVIYGYMKSGTHWLWEITRMILEEDTIVSQNIGKMNYFLETNSLSDLDGLKSPRILNTHLLPSELPEGILNCKVVVPIRNPKDVAVSMYHHLKAETGGTNLRCGWDKYIDQVWFDPDLSVYAPWNEFTSELWERCSNHDNYYLMVYEHLLENPLEMIRDLGNFLGKQLSEQRCQEITDATKIDKMRTAKRDTEKCFEATFDQGYTMFRKGQIGDWKNTFTEEQSIEFDQKMSKACEKDENLKHVMMYFN